MNLEQAASGVTDDQFNLIQTVLNVSRNGHPPTSELVKKVGSLIQSGLVRVKANGDLEVPAEAQQALARNGRLLRVR